jgi:hypothetical protein
MLTGEAAETGRIYLLRPLAPLPPTSQVHTPISHCQPRYGFTWVSGFGLQMSQARHSKSTTEAKTQREGCRPTGKEPARKEKVVGL